MPSSATRLYRGRVPSLTSDNFFVLPHTRQSGETMTSVSAGDIILLRTEKVTHTQRQNNMYLAPKV